MGSCSPSLWHRFQRYTLSRGKVDFGRWLTPGFPRVSHTLSELGFMRPRNECTELFAEHTYSPEHTYSECLSSCSSPVQPIHPEQGLHPSTRIDGWHELRCYSTVAPVGTYQLIFAWSDCEKSSMDFDKCLAKVVSVSLYIYSNIYLL